MKSLVGIDTAKQLIQTGQYVLQRPCLPFNKFIIFATGRSGSTLLVSLLNCSNKIHCDGEILNRSQVFYPHLYIDKQSSRYSSSVYGFKLLSYQLKAFHKRDPSQFLQDLYNRNYKIIYLTRRNSLYHALSQVNAIQKKKFHDSVDHDKTIYQPIRVDVNVVMNKIAESYTVNQSYDSILENIPHLKLTYEHNLKDSTSHQATADTVFNFLKVPSSPVKAKLRKIMPSSLPDMIDNHEELIEAIGPTKYSHFLEH